MLGLKVSEIAEALDGKFSGEDFLVTAVASLSKASASELSFWTERTASGEARAAVAGAVFVCKDFEGALGSVRALIRVENPYVAMVRFVERFVLPLQYGPSRVDETAQVAASAVVEGVVERGASVGPNCVVMRGAVVGEGTVLEANVTLYGGVLLGSHCVVQAGAVLGSRGFGFYYDGSRRLPVPHVAGVVVGDRVGIGANTVVASGFLSPTEIGSDTHIDALVQIGHNCTIGRNVYMAAQCALAGTTIVEDDVEMGGAAKASGHLTIGKGAKIAAKAGVIKNVPAGAMYAGFPAQDIAKWRKQVIALKQMGADK